MAQKTVAILAVRGVQLLDVSGRLDAFAEANARASRLCYRLTVIVGATPAEYRRRHAG